MHKLKRKYVLETLVSTLQAEIKKTEKKKTGIQSKTATKTDTHKKLNNRAFWLLVPGARKNRWVDTQVKGVERMRNGTWVPAPTTKEFRKSSYTPDLLLRFTFQKEKEKEKGKEKGKEKEEGNVIKIALPMHRKKSIKYKKEKDKLNKEDKGKEAKKDIIVVAVKYVVDKKDVNEDGVKEPKHNSKKNDFDEMTHAVALHFKEPCIGLLVNVSGKRVKVDDAILI